MATCRRAGPSLNGKSGEPAIPVGSISEIIVVDNASTDGTAEAAANAGARVVSEPRRGYGAACLRGIASLSDEIDCVVFLDADFSDHPLLAQPHPERVELVVLTSDRGLCGGLNINLFKLLLGEMRQWEKQGVEIDLCVIGTKARSFFSRFKSNIVASTSHLGDKPEIADLIGTVKVMLDAYDEGRIDRLFLAYNNFVNSMTQEQAIQQLIPLPAGEDEALGHHWDYIYEPEARNVVDGLLTRYIESLVYHGVVENVASEQAARMVAMKAATDNAGNLIDELQLVYNKARQAAITQEISEIVSGAAAV